MNGDRAPLRYDENKKKNVNVKETADGLEKVLNEVFDSGSLTVTYGEQTQELSVFIMYDARMEFHVDDIAERLEGGTLDAWVKANVSQALFSLSELIMEKVKELDG